MLNRAYRQCRGDRLIGGENPYEQKSFCTRLSYKIPFAGSVDAYASAFLALDSLQPQGVDGSLLRLDLSNGIGNAPLSATPEPATVFLALSALAGLAVWKQRSI